MSAFVVDDNTINKVIGFLYIKTLGDTGYWPARPLAEAGYSLLDKDGRESLANGMFDLNVRAVDERYGVGQASEFRALDFEYEEQPAPSAVAAFKALRCWHYQCTEGVCPQDELYTLMDTVSARMAMEIVYSSKEYAAANWGQG